MSISAGFLQNTQADSEHSHFLKRMTGREFYVIITQISAKCKGILGVLRILILNTYLRLHFYQGGDVVLLFTKTKRTNLESKIVLFFRNVPIFPRFFLIIGILSVFPILFLTLFYFQQYVVELKGNTQLYLSILTRNLASQVDATLHRYEEMALSFYGDVATIELLTNNNHIAENDPLFLEYTPYLQQKKTVEDRLYALGTSDRNIVNISLITPYDGYFMRPDPSSTHGALVLDLPSFRESTFFQDAVSRNGYQAWYDTSTNSTLIHKFDYSTTGIQNTFTMTTALYSYPERAFLGVLMLNIDVGIFRNNFLSYGFSGAGNTFLHTNSQILDHLAGDIHGPNFTALDFLSQDNYHNASGSYFGEDAQGNEIFAHYHQSEKLPIFVTHVVNMDQLLSPAFKIRENAWTIVVVMLVFALFLARITSLSIALPLRRLLDTMASFGQDLQFHPYAIPGKDELTIVEKHFKEMAENTRKLTEENIEARTREKDLQVSQLVAQLNALQMQINPHFMYNTLDIIRWKTIHLGGGESDASKMIDKFCKLMRMSIKKNEDYITVDQELAHVFAYLDVVNFANDRKINLITTIEFQTNLVSIPKLTLQPLVENAVTHGFRKNSQDPQIHIRGFQTKEHTIITITDNGKGMHQDKLTALREMFSDTQNYQESIGLRNVNQRFKLCFGEEYGVSVESVQDFGTEITIRLPRPGQSDPSLQGKEAVSCITY